MVRLIVSMLLVGLLSTESQAQLFGRFRKTAATATCPTGGCPTGTQWFNRDGLSPRAHLEHVHGTNTAGMSNAAVLQERNDYHNKYGAGHPVVESHSHPHVAPPVQRRTEVVTRRLSATVAPNSTGCPPCPTVFNCPPQELAVASMLSQDVSTMGRRLTFRQALMKAAGNKHRNGDLSILEYFAIARSSLNPTKLAEIQQAATESAIQEGLATTQAIDWDGLIGFLEKLIPLIVKLIDLFGYSMNDIETMLVDTNGATLIMNDGFTFFIVA